MDNSQNVNAALPVSAYSIRHMVLTGFSTSGVVLSTLREAADKDFWFTVLSDPCADRDPEVHTVLLTKVFSRQVLIICPKDGLRGKCTRLPEMSYIWPSANEPVVRFIGIAAGTSYFCCSKNWRTRLSAEVV